MRRKELSVAQREQIIGAYISGVRQKVISAQLDIPTSTINDTIKLYKETGYATPEKYPGRPKLLTQRDTRTLQRIVHDNRFSPLGDITNKFNFHLNTNLHYNTVRKYLRDEGLAYKEDCIQPTVKFGGESVMFWGCFGWHGVGPLIVVEGNMDSNDYSNILAGHFIPWVNNYPNSIFQQDKAPCHTSNYSVWWMKTHDIPILDLVVQSPDLNPIENLWNYLDHQVCKRKPLPKSKQELINVIQEEWGKISIETLDCLILSLPDRAKAVIKAKGGHTKY
ncbi:1387_t:CDS:2 [Entrophospora sp. SA101]|nr:10282_t:CDS:2 [Entrophospora sp. SA101]CAJ0751958.1 2094_t:CDS:2 [Entrophospora sp. SA101]CAJ0756684.1 18844_t:CDS:2 [Entrophospora sp. SA101]CAJ0769282.1 1387_t:CDS:2 [Entrophospora sp. SA101]